MKVAKKIILGIALFLTAGFLLTGIGARAAEAVGVRFTEPVAYDEPMQQPSEGNGCSLRMTLKYGRAENGVYRQAVKYVLRNLGNNKTYSYYESSYVTLTAAKGKNEATEIPNKLAVSNFGTPSEAGTYVVEVWSVSGPQKESLLYTSMPFDTGAVHNHDCRWRITTVGDPTCDQVEKMSCPICGYCGNVRVITALENYLNEAMMVIDATPKKGTVTIASLIHNTFTKDFMKKLSERRDLKTIIYLPYGGVTYKVTIPAKKKINLDYMLYDPVMIYTLYGGEIVAGNPATFDDQTLPKVSRAGYGDVVELFGKDSYTQAEMKVIAQRRDLFIVLKMQYKGKYYIINIPPGVKVDTSCDYYGPLKLASLYGCVITDI